MNYKLKVLSYLSTIQGSVSASQLSECVGVSKRTLSRIINDINAKDTIVISSHQGYSINFEAYKNSEYLKATNESRVTAIIKKLTFTHKKINLYDLADELFVSESSLKSDIKKVREVLNKYSLKLIQEKNCIFIEHNENKERNLIKDYIYGEASIDNNELFALENEFGNINTKEIKQIILSVFSQYQIFIDEYTLFNLLLHLVIKIQRTSMQFTFNGGSISESLKKNMFYQISENICKKLNDNFGVDFNEQEIYELGVLFSSNLHIKSNDNIAKEYVTESATRNTKIMVDYIFNIYGIDLRSSDFVKNMSLHIKNLEERLNNNIIIKNPLKDQILQMYPFVFEISLDVMDTLYPDKIMNQDEICYIALHIAASINMIEAISNKLRCVIISPDFYNLNKNLYAQIKNKFDDELYIKDVVSDETSINPNEFDIVLSTVKTNTISWDKLVHISLLLSHKDIASIEYMINKINQRKLSNKMKNQMAPFFSENNFCYVDKVMDYKLAISLAAKSLSNTTILPEGFIDNCLQREMMSPTSFKDIALPHPIRCDVDKSVMFVMSNKKHFVWSNKKRIKLIVLMAINKEDIKKISPFYEFLANYVNDTKEANLFSDIETFEEFIAKLTY